jgi:hypothetical protein
MSPNKRSIVTLRGIWLLNEFNIYARVTLNSPLDTNADIDLPDWSNDKAVTKELKLIKQLPKGEKGVYENLSNRYL